MTIQTITQQIHGICTSARRLRDLVGHPLPALDDDLYLRPTPTGCTAISVNPSRRPQQGIRRCWSGADLAVWKEDLHKALTERDLHQTRKTPEKALQSLLIRDAIRNHGRMEILSAACPEHPHLRFLTDELALDSEEGKTVIDLLAVRYDNAVGVPIVIELRSDRRLKRLTEQVSEATALIEGDRSAFEQMAQDYWGEPVRLTAAAERWIAWPTAGENRHGDLDPRESRCRAEKVRLVTYSGEPNSGFHLHASARIQP